MPQNEALARQQWARYVYCRDTGHLAFIDKAKKCEEYFAGIQWTADDLALLREARRPGLTINKVLGTLSSIMGEQIDLRSETAFKARYGAPSGNADTLTKVFRFISDKNQLTWLRSELFADGAITSRGYLDLRMNFDRSVTGDIQVMNLSPKNVIPDPDASEYDPDKWNDVIVTRWLTADDIEYMYNKKDADILRERSSSSWAYGYDSIDRARDRFAGSGAIGDTAIAVYNAEDLRNVVRNIRIIERQYKKLAPMEYFINTKTGDRKEIPHTWDRNKIAMIVSQYKGLLIVDKQVGQKIRWTVTADDIVLHDEWSPYKHFTVIPYFPYFRYGRTIGLVENLIDPQDLLNKTTSQELHVVNTTANSGWKVKTGSLKNLTMDELEQYGAKTGLVMELSDVKDAEKIQPNQIPQGLSELSRKGENYLKAVSMRGDAQTGMARADVSADQIDAQNAHGDVGMNKPMDNLKRTDFILARNMLDLVQEYMTDQRILLITHNDLTKEQEQITINYPDPETGEINNDVTQGEYDVVITSQSVKQTLETSQFEQAAYMKEKLGIQIPDEFMVENSNLINKGALVAALKEQSEGEMAQMQQKMKIMGGQLELANLKSENARVEADAVLKRSKAAHTLAQTQEIAGADPMQDKEMQLEQQKHAAELQQKQEQHDQDMEHERQKHQLEQETKAAAAKDDAALKKAQAVMAMRQQASAAAKPQPTKESK